MFLRSSHWLETLFKEINRLSHLDLINGGVVVVTPEVLDRLDLGADLLESGSIGPICRLLLVLLLSLEELVTLKLDI